MDEGWKLETGSWKLETATSHQLPESGCSTDAELFGASRSEAATSVMRASRRGLFAGRSARGLRGAHRTRNRSVPRLGLRWAMDNVMREYLQWIRPGRPLYCPCIRLTGSRVTGPQRRVSRAASPGHRRMGASQSASQKRSRRSAGRSAGALRGGAGGPGPAFSPDAACQHSWRPLFLCRNRRPTRRHRGGQARHGTAAAHGSLDLR